ncbi:MAG: hypothetical protein Q8N54_15165 [Sulfurimicrobium sp.]|jgi:hypothetical protein|nr:hypothetical protein [Sulfurimicrobium sp.]MDP3183726.1 hypothetical protein [Anaerolineales bacterium]
MKTGARFWKLVGLVFLILGAYGLAELHDSVKAGDKRLVGQQQLLSKQRALLHENHWIADLESVEQVRQAWLKHLPSENTAAVAKAHLLNDIRSMAKSAGMTTLSVTATEMEDNEAGKTPSSYGFNPGQKKTEAETLPAGVHLIKVKIEGRFTPSTFAALMKALEEEGRPTIVERVSVRGAQMELNLRCYWLMSTDKTAAISHHRDISLIADAH